MTDERQSSRASGSRRRFDPFVLLHPVLFAVWPALALYGQNANKLFPAVLLYPLLLLVGFAVTLTVIFRLIARDWARGAFAASFAIVALCVIWKPFVKGIAMPITSLDDWEFYSLFGYLMIVALAIVLVIRVDYQKMTMPMNIAAVALIAWPASQIVRAGANAMDSAFFESETVDALPGNTTATLDKPDVVLLVLDEYSRSDVLKERLNFDNNKFIEALRARGFFIATRSTSDYRRTIASLPSMLNMEYAHKLGIPEFDGPLTFAGRRLQNNRVFRFLDAMGYTTFAFSSGFRSTEPGPEYDHILPDRSSRTLTPEFRSNLLQFTPIADVLDAVGWDREHRAWRDHLLYILRNVHRPVAESPGTPAFVFAHVLCPHSPIVFDANGGFRSPEGAFTFNDVNAELNDSQERMTGQIQGLNKHVLAAVDNILATAEKPPIIIITGDHAMQEGGETIRRGKEILLAMHLPGPGAEIPREHLDTMHLVNLFRTIFNAYFGAEYPYLDPLKPKGDAKE